MMMVYMFIMQFDVTFPVLACSLLSVDAVDISGEQHFDIVIKFLKCLFCLYFCSTEFLIW